MHSGLFADKTEGHQRHRQKNQKCVLESQADCAATGFKQDLCMVAQYARAS